MNNLPKNWQVKSLGEIALITSGQGAPQGKDNFSEIGTPFIRAGSLEKLTNGFDYSCLEKIEDNNAKKLGLKLFPKGSVLLAKSGMSSMKDRVIMLKSSCYVVSHLAVINPNENLFSNYLAYFLRLFRPSRLIKDDSYPSIRLEDISQIPIPLPPLPIQKQIAEILEKADKAKQKRKEANKLTYEFLQSVFIEMFGDPVKNPKGWEICSLTDVCSKITDGTHDTPKRLKAGVKFITGKNIRPFYIDFTDLDYVTHDVHNEIYRRCNPVYGDILYTNIGVNVGTAVMNNLYEEFSMKNVALLKCDSLKIISRYLEHLLNNPLMKDSILNTFSIGGAQSFLSLNNLKRIRIPVPPRTLQQQFAEIVNKVEALKEKQKQSEQELENLFQSLMQKSFNGELM